MILGLFTNPSHDFGVGLRKGGGGGGGGREGRWRRFRAQISFSLPLESLPRRLAGNWENSGVIMKETPNYLQR